MKPWTEIGTLDLNWNLQTQVGLRGPKQGTLD